MTTTPTAAEVSALRKAWYDANDAAADIDASEAVCDAEEAAYDAYNAARTAHETDTKATR
jgi:hypothetical protein